MAEERFPRQQEHERTGGQHGTQNTGGSPPDEDAQAREQPSRDPQLRRVHENIEDADLPHRNDVPVEHGGARHRQQ